MIQLEHKQKIVVIGGLLIFFVVPIALTFYRTMVQHDSFVQYAVACDPEVSSCFVSECDWEEADCFRDMEDGDVAYYSIVTKKEKDSGCDAAYDESCVITCNEGEECTERFCEQGVDEFCSGDMVEEEVEAVEEEVPVDMGGDVEADMNIEEEIEL